MSRDGGRCFLLGLRPPSSPSATALAPHPETGGNTQLSVAIRSPQTPQLRSQSKRLWFPGTDDRQAGPSPPSQPLFPEGTCCRMLAGGRRMPPMPCPPCSREVAHGRASPRCPSRRSPGTTSSLRPNACDGEDFSPLSISSATLNFSIAQSVKQLFFPFIIQAPG